MISYRKASKAAARWFLRISRISSRGDRTVYQCNRVRRKSEEWRFPGDPKVLIMSIVCWLSEGLIVVAEGFVSRKYSILCPGLRASTDRKSSNEPLYTITCTSPVTFPPREVGNKSYSSAIHTSAVLQTDLVAMSYAPRYALPSVLDSKIMIERNNRSRFPEDDGKKGRPQSPINSLKRGL